MSNAYLSVEPFEAEFSEGFEKCKELTKDIASGWCSVETFTDLKFEALSGGEVPNFNSSFCGRVFSKDKEVRWLRNQGRWNFSVLSEADSGEDRYETSDERYYLCGEYDETTKDYWETRIARRSVYPVTGKDPRAHDRAYILVRHYYLKEPRAGIKELSEMEDFLNQPYLAQHRFLSVDVGRNSEPRKEK